MWSEIDYLSCSIRSPVGNQDHPNKVLIILSEEEEVEVGKYLDEIEEVQHYSFNTGISNRIIDLEIDSMSQDDAFMLLSQIQKEIQKILMKRSEVR